MKEDLTLLKGLHCCPRGNQWRFEVDRTQIWFASNVDIHGAMSVGEVLEEESFVCYMKAVALIGLRGHGRGGKRMRRERSLVAALSEIGAGEALLVRVVGVALFPVFSRNGGICVSVVFASRVLSCCRNRTRPLDG